MDNQSEQTPIRQPESPKKDTLKKLHTEVDRLIKQKYSLNDRLSRRSRGGRYSICVGKNKNIHVDKDKEDGTLNLSIKEGFIPFGGSPADHRGEIQSLRRFYYFKKDGSVEYASETEDYGFRKPRWAEDEIDEQASKEAETLEQKTRQVSDGDLTDLATELSTYNYLRSSRNPLHGYVFFYPYDWHQEEVQEVKIADDKSAFYYSWTSPSFHMVPDGSIAKGARVKISVNETEAETIEDLIISQAGRNIKNHKVLEADNRPAIQFEEDNKLTTLALNSGREYEIVMDYAGIERTVHADAYQIMLENFAFLPERQEMGGIL